MRCAIMKPARRWDERLLCGILEKTLSLTRRLGWRPKASPFSKSSIHGVLSFTGIQNTDLGCGANHHTPEFDMDERGLMMGSAMAVSYALAFLAYEGDIPFKKTDEPVEELVERNI